MSEYRATLTFDLPDGDGIDAATAASLLGERLAAECPEFRITSLCAEDAR